MGEDLALPLAVATGGRLTNIRGGSPIRFGDTHAGGLGIAGGTPVQDAEVAEAALARVGAHASSAGQKTAGNSS
jgi:glc operon protein GlcG